MKSIDLIKELRKKTFEKIIEKCGKSPGTDLTKSEISIWDVREILYEEAQKIAQNIFDEEFHK